MTDFDNRDLPVEAAEEGPWITWLYSRVEVPRKRGLLARLRAWFCRRVGCAPPE